MPYVDDLGVMFGAGRARAAVRPGERRGALELRPRSAGRPRHDPLHAADAVLGVLVVGGAGGAPVLDTEQCQTVDALVRQAGFAIGRAHLAVEAHPARPAWLITEPGVGYRLRDAPL